MARMQDEDLYGGYDDSSNQGPGGATSVFQAVGGDAAGAFPPGTAARSYMTPGTAMRMATAAPGGEQARPMTSNRGAGFSSIPNKRFDPLSQLKQGGGAASPLLKKGDASPEERAKEVEKKVHELLESSAVLAHSGKLAEGLELATEARKAERTLTKWRDSNGLQDMQNTDLTFAVEFNLAHMYHVNKNYKESVEMYTGILRNKQYGNAWRIRINMGNVYFEQKKYSTAIKMYRMALDQVPATSKEIRFQLMRNIGLAFVRMGQYQDALQAFTQVMENAPEIQTGYNLVVCTFALGDREGMKDAFSRLLTVKGLETEEEDEAELSGLITNKDDDELRDVVQDDGLKEELRKRQNHVTRCIVSAAQLISERIDKQGGFSAGFDWCAEQLRAAGLTRLANEVELAKASKYLANKEFEGAINVFKEFEKKEPKVKARAATNLSFLYMLEGQTEQAEKYTELALKSDSYSARAQVNKGCVLVERGDLEGARTVFEAAVKNDPTCVEGLYNLGLLQQRLGESQDALASFKKLHKMLPDNYEVLWQIAMCHDMENNFTEAVKTLEMLSSLVPNDPGVLARLGAIYARMDDETRALHYYQESHRVYPVHMDVISWLGAYHVKHEVYEKAMPYFDLASKVQPQEVKWALMVASCYRRIGAYPQALAKYKEINTQHPGNVECLRYLVHLCTELGRREDAQKYMTELRKAEVAAAAETKATVAAMAMAQQPDGGRPMGMPMGGVAGQGEGFVATGADGNVGLNVPVARGKKVVAKEDGAGHDDWGNEELGDDLLPMGE